MALFPAGVYWCVRAGARLVVAGNRIGIHKMRAGVSIFAETFHTTVGRLEGSEVVTDLGTFRGLGRHAQIDLEAGHTVAGERPSWFASVGLVLRDPRTLLGPAYLAAFSRNSPQEMVQPK
jgi:hypothetical protein